MKGSQMNRAVKEIVAKTPSIQQVYLGELPIDWEERGLPAALIYRVGGTSTTTDRIIRYRVSVWGVGLTEVSDATEDIRDTLVPGETWCSSHLTSFGVIDDVEVQEEAVDVPYTHATIRQTATTFRITTRAL